MTEIEVLFPGSQRVDAEVRGHTVRTDQPRKAGGDDSAAAPFDLFLASIATCAGLYAMAFCRRRGIGTAGLGLTLAAERDPETRRLETIRLRLRLPAGFPEKYRAAIVRAMDQCAVKRVIDDPPRFETEVAAADRAGEAPA